MAKLARRRHEVIELRARVAELEAELAELKDSAGRSVARRPAAKK